MSLSASSPGIWTSRSDATSRRESIASTVARTRRVVCLSRKRWPGRSGSSVIQQICACSRRVTCGASSGRHIRSPRLTSRSSAGTTVTDIGGNASETGALGPVDALDRRAVAGREHDHLVARPQHAARHLPRVAAVVVLRAAARADRELHREARGVEVAVGGDLDLLEVLEQRRPVVVGRLRGALDDVVALQRRHRDRQRVRHPELLGHRLEAGGDLAEAVLVPVDEVHLVHARDHVADPEQGGDVRVPVRLLEQPVDGVDEHQRGLRGRGAGDHVARVPDVARRVGDDERALRRGEEAVRDVDRDALLALGAQPVGEPREVDLRVGHLVGHQRLGVVEQPADQRRLAVVDRAGGGEPQQGGRH